MYLFQKSLIMSVSSSHLMNMTAPKSPRVTSIRQAMYKKSPGKSPLREMIKSRCQNRMRADREKLINGVRNINMDEGKSFVENTIRMFVKVFEALLFLIFTFYYIQRMSSLL